MTSRLLPSAASRSCVGWRNENVSQFGKSTLVALTGDSSDFRSLDGPRYHPRPSRRSYGILERFMRHFSRHSDSQMMVLKNST